MRQTHDLAGLLPHVEGAILHLIAHSIVRLIVGSSDGMNLLLHSQHIRESITLVNLNTFVLALIQLPLYCLYLLGSIIVAFQESSRFSLRFLRFHPLIMSAWRHNSNSLAQFFRHAPYSATLEIAFRVASQ